MIAIPSKGVGGWFARRVGSAPSSRLVRHHRPPPPRSCCFLSDSPLGAALRRKAVQKFGAPASIGAVLDDAELLMSSSSSRSRKPLDSKSNSGRHRHRRWGAAVRQVGSTRRVILADPHLTPAEMEGLAYRIKVLTRNRSLSSILITSTDERVGDAEDDETLFLPSLLLDRDSNVIMNEHVDPGLPPAPGCTYLVASGYDPQRVNRADAAGIADLMTHASALALAVRGSSYRTCIPTVCLPHGMVQNAGYAFLHASYVLATRETGFQITTPAMGLALDPVGLSYALPRLGREFGQPSRAYPTGMLLAITGYQATAEDCVETGLATHYVDTSAIVGDLEHAFSQLPPYEQQTLVKPPKRFHAQVGDPVDLNRVYRNVTLADTIHCYSDYAADGAEMWANVDLKLEDPSLEVDDLPWHEDRTSDLVDYAAAFADILREPTLVRMYDRLREVAAKEEEDGAGDEEKLAGAVAKQFCRRIAAASPLALTVTHRLLQLGGRQMETWESCMERERRVQAKLLRGEDFGTWQATHGTGTRTKWKHSSLKEVTKDEVTEIVDAND